MAALKWIPMSQRFEIFDGMVKKYFMIRDNNIEE